jgi:hypothetical protein
MMAAIGQSIGQVLKSNVTADLQVGSIAAAFGSIADSDFFCVVRKVLNHAGLRPEC